MGICLCDKHGRAGIAVVCRHVSEEVSRGRYGGFHRVRVLGEDVICGDCFRATGLDALTRARVAGAEHGVELARLGAAIEAYFAAIERLGRGTTAHCAECVAAAEVTQARMDGRPDPFPVFERTMTSHHRGALSELRGYLTGELSSREPAAGVELRSPAVSVSPGTYRQPLTVRAYHVVDAAAQERVIGLVSAFLTGRELDQARVEFYETEVWETTGLGLRRRGEELLLRHALLNC